MSSNEDTVTRWLPTTAAEREVVLLELNSILSSHHFRNSKRYPALLRYVVDETLGGHAEELKERTLGIEVFDRQPDYDTNADPVVRCSASEIRKKIAQYYQESDDDHDLRIALPLGSYVPEFKLRSSLSSSNRSDAPEAETSEPHHIPDVVFEEGSGKAFSLIPPVAVTANPASNIWRRHALKLGVAALVIIAIGGYSIRRPAKAAPLDALWAPLMQSSSPVMIVVGSGHPEGSDPDPTKISLHQQLEGPYHNISISSAVALSRLAVVLERNGKANEIKEGSGTSLADLRSRSIILVGGLNNRWALRLLEPLRFHFDWSVIRDSKNPSNLDWSLDFGKTISTVSTDYAIVARYHDATTDGNVMVIAGIGPYGTEAASQFVSSPNYLEQLARSAPRNWETKNLEIVLKTDVINGEAGPPSIVSSTVW